MLKKRLLVLLLMIFALMLPTNLHAQAGGELRIVHGVFEQNWSPLTGGGPHIRWNSLAWASPLYFDEMGALQPYVFTEWSPNEDFTTWNFTIAENAVFSDRSPITADEVIGSWNLAARPAARNERINLFLAGVEGFGMVTSGEATAMEGLVAVDDRTVAVTLSTADPIFNQRIASHLIPIIKASAVADENGDPREGWYLPENGVVVSGPFMPESINLDTGELSFVPNPNFFGPAPQLERISFITVDDPQTATLLLQNGEADAHTELVTPTIVEDLGPEFSTGPLIPKGQQFWLDMNAEPTNDINVRRALIMSVNTQEMYDILFPEGPNAPATQILNAVVGVDGNYEAFPFDPDAAREALAASSYGSAENLPTIRIVGISLPQHELAAQYMAEQWRQILGIERVEFKPQFDDYSGVDENEISIFRDDVGARVPDAVTYLQGAIASTSGNATSKMGGYNNPALDGLLIEAASLATDDPRRTELAQEAQRLFREDWMYIPYYYETMSRWAMPWVTNMEKNLDWQVVEPWNITNTR